MAHNRDVNSSSVLDMGPSIEDLASAKRCMASTVSGVEVLTGGIVGPAENIGK